MSCHLNHKKIQGALTSSWTCLRVFLLKLTQPSVSGLDTSQWSHNIQTFTLQEFYRVSHVSLAKREREFK